jgi:hypothetical protein
MIARNISNLSDHPSNILQFVLEMMRENSGYLYVATLAANVDLTVGSISVSVPSDITPGVY